MFRSGHETDHAGISTSNADLSIIMHQRYAVTDLAKADASVRVRHALVRLRWREKAGPGRSDPLWGR
jgi:hypothetical protein